MRGLQSMKDRLPLAKAIASNFPSIQKAKKYSKS